MRRAWFIPVAGAVLAPLVTWWPMLAYRFPWTGLPNYPAAQGIDFWSAQTYWLVAVSLLAFFVGREDRYLGLAVALAGLTIFWRGARMDPTHSVLFAFGAAMVVVMRRTPAQYHRRIASVLVGLGVFEILYVLHQSYLRYDLFWGPLFGGNLITQTDRCLALAREGKFPGDCLIQPLGTLGTVDAASAYIAILAPLMPWWVLPIVLLAIWKGHAVSATISLAAGLGVKYRNNRFVAIPLVGLLACVAWWSAFAKSVNPLATHLTGRGAIWGFATGDWLRTDPLIGYGLGGWAQRIPSLQVAKQFSPTGELWREAHNEYLQWLVEAGVIGVILLGLWLWSQRAMFAHPVWGGSLAAAGVNALMFFPLHVVQIAMVVVILVGLATAPTRVAHADPSPAPEWGAEQGE
jgi:O-antigen ligase